MKILINNVFIYKLKKKKKKKKIFFLIKNILYKKKKFTVYAVLKKF